MFMSDVSKTDEIKSIASHDLRKLGVKCRIPKKIKLVQLQNNKENQVFKMPLSALSMQTVTLRTGQQINVPQVIHEMCSYILPGIETVGLFRQEGSKPRQMEIKSLISAHRVWNKRSFTNIEMCSVLKMLLRDLPDPLIPFALHELFLRCVLLENHKLEAILLACLFMPTEHLNTLSYLMQFFQEVSTYSETNKMTTYNLAVCIGPSIFPVADKYAPDLKLRLSKTCELTELLISNAAIIGVLPENIIDRIGNDSKSTEEVTKKTKRRSGSLTRMFNGLKKIVVGKSEDNNLSNIVTPDLLLTPINRSMKKRRIEHHTGLSNKKKKDLLNILPDNKLLNNKPFALNRTPVNMNLNGKPTCLEETKEKKWYLRSMKSTKSLKQDSHKTETKNKTMKIERRWSSDIGQINLKKEPIISNNNNLLQKVHSSPIIVDVSNNKKLEGADYVRVPKVEYEEIKNRVSAIERRISYEFENVQSKFNDDTSNLRNVQTAYEQTLQQAKFSPTTDQLAKRLSRELKIRRKNGGNGDDGQHKIIRSPSARKIGSMRRRSHEKSTKLIRHQSWHLGMKQLKRHGNPTTSNGLRRNSTELFNSDKRISGIECNVSSGSTGDNKWTSAEGYFSTSTCTITSESSFNSRASIAKLRNENAGMVLAKAKLFDDLTSNDEQQQQIPKQKSNKIGSLRTTNMQAREQMSNFKFKQLTNGDRLVRKSISPKHNKRNLSNNQNIMKIAKHVIHSQQNNNGKIPNIATPNKQTPNIKKSLTVKSPKRLCRTPAFDKNTPLKVLNAQRQF